MAQKKEAESQGSKATKRSRWATRRLTVRSSGLKRLSIMDRIGHKSTSTEKKRQSGGSGSIRQENGVLREEEEPPQDEPHSTTSRRLFFNLPLPKEMLDEDGNPAQTYPRNKIRTAKYTPLSFIPKNLWFQFQNVANIFFLFVVILVVSAARGPDGRAEIALTVSVADIPNLWHRQCGAEFSSPDLHHHGYGHQRRHRRLQENGARQ